MENFSLSAGKTRGLNHEILSRLILSAPATAPLKIAPSSAFLTRVRLCFKPYTILLIVLTKTKDVLHWNSIIKGTFDGWGLDEICMPCSKFIIVCFYCSCCCVFIPQLIETLSL